MIAWSCSVYQVCHIPILMSQQIDRRLKKHNTPGELGSMNVVSLWKQSEQLPKPSRALLGQQDRVYIFDCVR